MDVLVAAASREGSTLEIAESIARVLREQGLEVSVGSPDAAAALDGFDAVVLGSAVYRGHWLPAALAFARARAADLAARPVWLFSSGPVGDPDGRLTRSMYADPLDVPELLELTRAHEHRLFAGRLTAADQPPLRRLSLRLVRGVDGDFRDWQAIEEWAKDIAGTLAHAEWYRRLDTKEDVG